jgi:hypothetical protein
MLATAKDNTRPRDEFRLVAWASDVSEASRCHVRLRQYCVTVCINMRSYFKFRIVPTRVWWNSFRSQRAKVRNSDFEMIYLLPSKMTWRASQCAVLLRFWFGSLLVCGLKPRKPCVNLWKSSEWLSLCHVRYEIMSRNIHIFILSVITIPRWVSIGEGEGRYL